MKTLIKDFSYFTIAITIKISENLRFDKYMKIQYKIIYKHLIIYTTRLVQLIIGSKFQSQYMHFNLLMHNVSYQKKKNKMVLNFKYIYLYFVGSQRTVFFVGLLFPI